MHIERSQAPRLKELLERFPVVAVVGPRQVGKSTLVQDPAIGAERTYRTLDDFAVLDLAKSDPRSLLAGPEPVTIDEVQRCPDLLRAIKSDVDRSREKGRFLVTGSSDLNLTANLAGELAGRVGVLPLLPITWRESCRRRQRPQWLDWIDAETLDDIRLTPQAAPPVCVDEAIFRGGFPPALTATAAAARTDWFESYRYTYLERDVRQVSRIGDLTDFARLINLAASRTGSLLNQAAAARDAGLSAATAGRYLSVLEATFQIVRLTPWFANIGKRLVKSPKLYWEDSGLAAHLLGLRTLDEAVSHGLAGPLFETFIMMEVRRQLGAYEPSARLHFVRSHTGLEIDGLIVRGVRQLPFEIKFAETVRGEDAAALHAYLDACHEARIGIVLYRGDEPLRLSSRVMAVPIASLVA